jgi:hypothetical protein
LFNELVGNGSRLVVEMGITGVGPATGIPPAGEQEINMIPPRIKIPETHNQE